ncbi:MAG TPA: ATP phosphoribosyltransferase regulatory subunit, partial [Chloroflexota bacterium]|nr:ATP phosphoribosyltransferase regulatory subunit [Chloroflexota bacterium]
MERRPVERVRGTQDSWAPEAQQLAAVRHQLEETFASYGYSRIDVPVLEPAELHLRKSGLEIISKLYAFEDQAGRQLCLRPELTASVVRAFVAQPPPRLPVRLFSSGPVFRYERPSKG